MLLEDLVALFQIGNSLRARASTSEFELALSGGSVVFMRNSRVAIPLSVFDSAENQPVQV